MDETPKKRDLSEISHLFLSSVRDRQTGGSPRPQRTPPPRSLDHSIDLTPEEFAQVFGAGEPAAADASVPVHAPPVCAILGAHLNGKQFDHVKSYARHLASRVGRVGLIELDASEFRLMCFDPSGAPAMQHAVARESAECYDPRQMIESLAELNCDVNQWILLLPNPRTPEARALLRQVDRWILLSTCDHDGIVSSYRLLKGLGESAAGDVRPALSLALLDARDADEAARVSRKLAGVCEQFLRWDLSPEPPVQPIATVSEHLAMFCRPTRDKAQLATAPQWQIVGDFLATAKKASEMMSAVQTPEYGTVVSEAVISDPVRREMLADVVIPTPSAAASPAAPPTVMPTPTVASAPTVLSAPTMPVNAPASRQASPASEVIELNDADAGGEAILSAILRPADAGMIECPVRPPMCPQARLAITRQREVVLLAVAPQGLKDLPAIAQAFRWLSENRTLIGMAVPQLAIDPAAQPRLRLLVDQADVRGELLQPLLGSSHVTVQAYRRVRWGERTGLLLEAA